MTAKGVNIVGLGRCVIGNLKNNFLSQFSHLPTSQNNFSFHHHYILNLLPCLLSNRAHLSDFCPLPYRFSPSLEDQINCIHKFEYYDLLIVEIFPGAPVYKHNLFDIYACFENYTQELANHGFRIFLSTKQNRSEAKKYAQHLATLVKKAKSTNPSLKIILINGEYAADNKTEVIGNPFILELLNEIRANNYLNDHSIKLLDVINILTKLSNKNIAFYETEFPYHYIRHTKEMEAISFARDCKHASPFLRQVLLREFCRYLIEWNFQIVQPDIDTKNRAILSSCYRDRANTFMQQHEISLLLFEDGNARKLSLALEYCRTATYPNHSAKLKKCIQTFFEQQPRESSDLKSFLYHTRTLSAWIYNTHDPDYLPICIKVIERILGMQAACIIDYYNFAIIWVTNLILACNQIIDKNHHLPHLATTTYSSLIDQLESHSFLYSFNTIKLIITASRQRLKN